MDDMLRCTAHVMMISVVCCGKKKRNC